MPAPARKTRQSLTRLSGPCLLGPIIAGAVQPGEHGLPRRVKIAAWGENRVRTPEGEVSFFVTAHTASRLPELQRRRGLEVVPLDFEHQTHTTPAPHKVAGHGAIEVLEGDGVYYVAASYTQTGREHAEHYPDVSGVFWLNAQRELLFVSSVALCQAGAIERAEFREAVIAASMESQIFAFGDDRAGTAAAGEHVSRIIALAREMLGYGEDAEAGDIADAMDAWLRQRRREAELRAKASSKPQSSSPQTQPDETVMNDETKSLIEEQSQQIKDLAASVKLLTDAHAASARDAVNARHNEAVETVIAAAVQAGKVVPASVKAKNEAGRYVLDAEGTKEILEAIPASVPVKFGAQAKSGAGNVIEASEEFAIAASMGISEAEWKAGPKVKQAAEPGAVRVA